MRTTWASWSLMVGASLCAAGCAGPNRYAGTGSLSVSGSTTQPLLAFNSVEFDRCRDPGHPGGEEESPGFSILAIGSACVMDGTGGLDNFRVDPGTVCTLAFPDGAHAIRVTDFAARFGVTSFATGRTYVDPSYIQVELGGEDAATRTHVLYRFSGSGSAGVPPTVSCDAERAKRASREATPANEDHQHWAQ